MSDSARLVVSVELVLFSGEVTAGAPVGESSSRTTVDNLLEIHCKARGRWTWGPTLSAFGSTGKRGPRPIVVPSSGRPSHIIRSYKTRRDPASNHWKIKDHARLCLIVHGVLNNVSVGV
ncbi:hypothetical protein MLD38_003247 [Melastoma candidum]|uniref:Uncharacterized protein n=1 Tax=Melastoma candidum TaxID=119954 RepID=A0ACB9S3I9_9MYRT|nr:hypothetical protein MLD38_003247 [Melastoma candidum]